MLQKTWNSIGKKDQARLAAQSPAPGVNVVRGVPYLDDGDEMHLLNLYIPQNADGPLPTIVDIHGGGWMYGDKDLNRNFCMTLAAQGFAVMGMSYRLLPHTNLLGQLQDVFASLHWLQAHGHEHHCDLARVFITGDSAGGHLGGLATCVQLSPALQRVYGVQPLGFDIRALALNHAVCELDKPNLVTGKMGDTLDREMRRMMFGAVPEAAPWYGKASFSETAKGLPLPPVLLVSSEADSLHGHSLLLQAWLQSHGARCQTKFWGLEGGEKLGHIFNIAYPQWEESRETNDEMVAFFRRWEHSGGVEGSAPLF